MKTSSPNKNHFLRIILVLAFGVFFQFSFGQEKENDTVKGFSKGKIKINNPKSILESYSYDPKTDRYIYTKSFDGFNINYPIILTPKEYQKLALRESMRQYFKEKSDAIDGKKEGSEEKKKNLLPRYYVNSSFFESIFGSNTIDVKPTGSVEIDLGMRYSKQDNPAFSPQNRSSLTFDFDQRISMSLMGKVGTRLSVNANYDTQSTFAFQNLIKLEYAPTEDDIIQKIEVGNVSMPLSNSLVRGAQSLFGVKAQLQFGKTTVTGVFSEQKSQTKSVTSQGGGTIQDFELFGLDYDADRHFFLSQYFRNNYDSSLKSYPIIDSRVQITRLEVWVTNKQNRILTANNNLRNVVALQDLGETQATGLPNNQVVALTVIPPTFFTAPIDNPSDNANNQYNPLTIGTTGLLNLGIRDITAGNAGFNNSTNILEGRDYSKLENARKLTATEYTFHPQLGYLSLQQKLANDEVLAVAYQYTIGGVVYQVGEFGTDGVDATQVTGGIPSSQSLILKMLKSNLTDVTKPVWNLMMKNIYQIQGGYQLQQDNFRFNILYSDPSPINYISPVAGTPFPPNPQPDNRVFETPLLRVFNVDKLSFNNDPQPNGDGFFDFIPGLTIDTQNGRIIFTTKEPFGRTLFEKLRLFPTESYLGDQNSTIDYNANQKKFVFKNMYVNTQASALQDSDKNKFLLKGKFKTSTGDGIPIGAFNVPKGSVVVTAAGRRLVEGVDFTVNYQAGRVQILDPSLKASNTPITVSVENNSVFGQQTRRFYGVNIEHKFSENFLVGATLLRLSERPFTQKSNYGQESVNNTIYGFNVNYSTEVPFLTRLANKLPNVDTDIASKVSFRGEMAYLKPDTPSFDKFNGQSTVYVDDFEGSQSNIDMSSALAWSLSSVPVRTPGTTAYPDFNEGSSTISYGDKRARLNWYSIDPIFYSQRPSGISNDDLSLNATRRVFTQELYNVDIAQGQTQVLNTLDLSYFPTQRGPYNFNAAAASNNILPNPTTNFGGIMRAINATNFQQSNVEYIQFWIMDPYYDPRVQGAAGTNGGPSASTNTGKILFNLGEISEDVLKDGRKQFENGLGAGQITVAPQPIWGNVPATQSLIYAFDTDPGNRAAQDIGLDGLNDNDEAGKFPAFAGQADPSADNFNYFLNTTGDIFDRYRNYNGFQNNSPVEVTDTNRGNSTVPDVEDINRDNTMNTINAYYEYGIKISPTDLATVGQNYITDIQTRDITNLPNSEVTKARWIQFKIPVTQPERIIGGISDFTAIRFMRMFMTGFNDKVTVRFGGLDLVRGEWRKANNTIGINVPLQPAPPAAVIPDPTSFNVQAVNIQENGDRFPVNYITPPNVVREQIFSNNTLLRQNEQSLALNVSGTGLEPGDSRGVFKNVSVDMRQFKRLKMFLHAEALTRDLSPLQDNEMVGFIRFGNDFSENFYQVEIPLKVTQAMATNPFDVWPAANEMDISLELLTKLKILNINKVYAPGEIAFKVEDQLDSSLSDKVNKLTLGIRGNPNFGLIRTLMVGIKNKSTQNIEGEVWFNELRLEELDNKGGWAAIASLDANMADFASITSSGKMSTVGFGTLEQKPNERSRDDIKQYNIVTNFSLGKLLPKKWGVNLPFNYAVGEEFITPKYDPFNQDIELNLLLENTASEVDRSNIRNRAIDYTKRRSINFIGVKKNRGEKQKQHFYDPENLTLSHSYNEVERHNFEIQNFTDQQVNTTADYTFAFQPKLVEPFKKIKTFSKSNYWKMLSDFNFNYLPSSISFSSNIIRQYNRQQFRLVDVEGIGLEALYRRNYLFNYQYGFNYNLTKNLKLNFNATSNNVVRNYLDEQNNPDNSYTIWTDYWNIGTANQHTQQLVVNYELPLNKLPFFNFVKANYTYTGDYNWRRASLALSSFEKNGQTYDLGNTIQNAGSHKITMNLGMDGLYRYLGLNAVKQSVAKPSPLAPKPGEKVKAIPAQVQPDKNVFLEGLKGVLTSIKTVQIGYTETKGTVLPGYTPGIGFFGTSKPTLGFVFGNQDDVRYEAAKNGWLTNYPDFNQSFTQVTNKTITFSANADLFPDFKIDFNADRKFAENFSEQFDVTNGQYNSRSPFSTGNFAISTVLLKSAFKASDEFESTSFNDFRANRIIVADRLAESYYGNTSFARTPDGFPVGFGRNSQSVLLPSFLAAYSGLISNKKGEDAQSTSLGLFRNIPIPNWTIKYNGLMRFAYFKEHFKRFSIQHAYKASYTLNSFRSNINPNPIDANGNFYSNILVSNVNLVEQFSPLIKIDFETKSSFQFNAEMKKDRALSLSFDNNLLTEVKGFEYVLGMGYRIKDVIFSSKLSDDPTGIIKSDIILKLNFSYRNNKTIIRYLDYDNNQLGGGQNIYSAKLTADYSFSKNLTAIFFYDHQFSKAVISTSFPLTNIRSGFTLRYNFGN